MCGGKGASGLKRLQGVKVSRSAEEISSQDNMKRTVGNLDTRSQLVLQTQGLSYRLEEFQKEAAREVAYSGRLSFLRKAWEKRPTWLRPVHEDQVDGGNPESFQSPLFFAPHHILESSDTFSEGAVVASGGKVVTGRRRWLMRDRTWMESFVNVATSVPFLAVGLATPRHSKSADLYGKSVIGVGLASSAYHISRGHARKFFRWGDYAMIAASSMCLSNAIWEKKPPGLMVASAALLPFQPLAVIALHTTLLESSYVQRVIKEPSLRPGHRVHAAAALAGGALYLADEVFPNQPFIHAVWHLAAALGIHTANELLK